MYTIDSYNKISCVVLLKLILENEYEHIKNNGGGGVKKAPLIKEWSIMAPCIFGHVIAILPSILGILCKL